MKEWLFSVYVVGLAIFVAVAIVNWLMMPRYVERIADELKEIKEILKK